MRWLLAAAAAAATTRALTPTQVRSQLALTGETTAALKTQIIKAAKGTRNGVDADERKRATVAALCDELEARQDKQLFAPLEGEHSLVFTTVQGGSSGKLGPFVGDVTQTFLDDVKFVNSVELGPLRLALQAKRTPKDGQTYRVDFESLGVELFGFKLFEKAMGGGGAWKLRYVDDDLRIMDTPSLFVLKRRTAADDVGLRDVLADPARFMEDPD